MPLLTFLYRLFAPTFPDEGKTRRARILASVVWTSLLSLLGATLLGLVTPPEFLSSFSILGIALALLYRGHVRAASVLFVTGIWLFMTAAMFLGLLDDYILTAYGLIIVIAGLVLGGRIALGLAQLSTLALLAASLNQRGSPTAFLTPADVVLSFIHLNTLAVLLGVAERGIRKALAALRREVEERQQAEASLRYQKTLLFAQNDASHEGILVTSPKGEVLSLNRRFADLWSLPEEAVAQPSVTHLLAHMEAHLVEPESFRHWLSHWITLEVPSPPSEFHLRDGSVFVQYLVPLRQGTDMYGSMLFCRNVTSRKRAEAQWVQARDEAERASRAKSEFLANMSHELRTPLNAIIGYSEILAEDAADEANQPLVNDLTKIRTAARHLLALIEDVLDFSKIEAQRLVLEQHPLDLRACAQAALELVSTQASHKGLTLACDLDPELPPLVLGDALRFRQVLVNLLTNAVKFTDAGEVRLLMRAHTRGDGVGVGQYAVEVAVRDTGIGIPPERMGDLFEAFSQVDASPTRRHGGTGLGLAISQQLVELMGGRIEVDSIPGSGSTFRFILPMQAALVAALDE